MSERIKNELGRPFLVFLAIFPFLLLRAFARLCCFFAWHSNSRIRKVIAINIDICFPQLNQEEKQRLAKQALLETITTGLEMPRMWLYAKPNDEALFGGMRGQNLIEEALSLGKGLIIIGPHLGHWEYFILSMASRYPCTVLCNNADDIVATRINDTIKKGRMKTGAKIVEATQGIKPLVEALRRGEIVMITPDQIPSQKKGYIFADFYTQKTATMTLIPRLAKVTSAPMLTGFAKRQACGRYEVIIKAVDEQTYSKNLNDAVDGMNKTVEHLISEAPAQYLWTYKRFRVGPNGKTKIYKTAA
jgi:KDO2-lipid IV(A) lauroyltransferase